MGKREEQKNNFKQKLFAAAKAVLLRDGYESLSVRRVAAEINCSLGALYNYYKDKNALISEIYNELNLKIHTELDEMPFDFSKPNDALQQWLLYISYIYFEEREIYISAVLSCIDTVNTNSPSGFEMLHKIVKNGAELGIYKTKDHFAAAVNIYMAIHSCISRIALQKITDESLIASLIETTLAWQQQALTCTQVK